ncbi:hypothetical protein pb186bvf_006201 [Paramecium bursaria]
MDQTKKKVKVEIDTRIFIELRNAYGESTLSLDLPITSTVEDLQKILQTQLQEEEQIYSFFVGNQELNKDILTIVNEIKFNQESSLQIVYHPQSLFRIKPLTRQTAAMEGHEQPVLCVQFHTLGHILATGSGDTSIRIWDILTETPVATMNGHKNWVLCLSWSPDCLYIVSGDMNGHLCLWNSEYQQVGQIMKGHTKWVTSIAWEPMHINQDCDLFASSSKDGTVRIWSRASLNCLLSISAHQKCITKMLWGNFIYTASEDTTINVWNKNGTKVQELKGHAHWVNTIALCTDFTQRTACFSEQSQELNRGQAKQRMQKFLDGKFERLVSGSDDKTLILWEMKKPAKQIRMPGHQAQVNHVQFSPDGRYIVSASFDKSLRIWDGYTGDFICVLRGHVGPVYQVSWSSDSRYMVSASKDSTIKLWSLQKKKLLNDLPGHADEVYAIDWAPIGGEKAASGGKDKLVKIWRH